LNLDTQKHGVPATANAASFVSKIAAISALNIVYTLH